MLRMKEYWLERPSLPRLRYALVAPTEATGVARAAVFITPGFGEHIGRFLEFAEGWAAAGYLVGLYDPRGQGRSEGRRGHVMAFDDYVEDALALLADLDTHPAWRSLPRPILFGNSLGGLISGHVALRAPARYRGLALSSPYFGRALRTPALRIWAGRLASRLWPTYSDRTGIKAAQLTHDSERARSLADDPLGLSRVTARWFVEVERAQKEFEAAAHGLRLPVFCQAAGEDSIADAEATRRIMSRFTAEGSRLLVREGAFHELHEELERREYMATFAAWFDELTPPARDTRRESNRWPSAATER